MPAPATAQIVKKSEQQKRIRNKYTLGIQTNKQTNKIYINSNTCVIYIVPFQAKKNIRLSVVVNVCRCAWCLFLNFSSLSRNVSDDLN